MIKQLVIVVAIIILIFGFTGCAEDNIMADGYGSGYSNGYDQQRNLDYVAQDAVYDASKQLSAQDIKNINNLK